MSDALQSFPAEEPRQYQGEVIEAVLEKFEEGKDVVAIDAPPGFGKSMVNYTVMKEIEGNGFYATPLKALQEQLTDDDFFGDDIVEIMGRSNYPCIHPEEDDGTMVDEAICQRKANFDCEIKNECEYYGQKFKALNAEITVVNLSYLMAEGQVDPEIENSFGNRDVVVIDECQGLPSWALSFVGATFSKFTIADTVLEQVSLPDEEVGNDIDKFVKWVVKELKPVVSNEINRLASRGELTKKQSKTLEQLKRLDTKISRLIGDYEDHAWTADYSYEIRKNQPNFKKVECKPVKVGRFLEDLTWNRGEKIILSSATIPKGDWFSEIGLEDREIARIPVPSTFPVENRPIITEYTVGKMTKGEREENMPDAVKMVKNFSDHHDSKGIVHCRGYNYIEMFKRSANNHGMGQWYRDNVKIQRRSEREESLEEWKEGDEQVFLSVNMAEGIDLKGDRFGWQVLLKTLYPHMGDKRVQKRKEIAEEENRSEDFWNWYNAKAVNQIEQAYGRAVRSKDDEAVFYILDQSAIGLVKRNADLFHKWFLNGLDFKVRGQDEGEAYAYL